MPLTPLSREGGPQTDKKIIPVFEDKTVIAAVLANHGAIGVGANLMKAQYLAEIIEETAHIAFVRDTVMAARSKTTMDLRQYGTAAEVRTATE